MSNMAYVGTEVDQSIMDAAANVLHEAGFTISEMLSLTIAKIARDKRLPFDVESALVEEYGDEIPNALTRETMKKVLRGEDLHNASNLDDLMRQLDS